MITEKSYGNDVDIRIASELAFELPCIVSNAGVVANEDGKKIIKAGTPLYGENYFMNRQEVLKTSGTTAYGVALHDIDVTAGDTNDTLLISGYVDYLKLDSSVQSLVDAAKSSLTRILFVKGRAK